MKKLYFLFSFILLSSLTFSQSVIITRVVDGGLASDGCSGTSGASSPKAIELYVDGTIDFTAYTYDLYSNGGTSANSESLFDLGIITDAFVYIVLLGETTFDEILPGATKHIGGGTFNGDDTITITSDGSTIVDQFGVIGVDGSGEVWEYLDTYAKRNDSNGPNSTFTIAEWTIGTVNEFDGTDCATLSAAVSFGTFTYGGTPCGISLGTAVYACSTSTLGDNNDGVTVEIPYTGLDATITSVTTTSGGSVAGDNPALVTDGIITITGLFEGDSWDITINGGNCDGLFSSGTTPAAECDPTPDTCFNLSDGSNEFEIVTLATNADGDVWTNTNGTYAINGFCGGGCTEETNGWLIFGPLDMQGASDLSLLFTASESFGVTDLNIQYTSDYSSLCPDSSTWTSAAVITDAGTYSVDLSAAAGNDVFVGIEYNDSDGSFSGWSLTNVELAAFGQCPTLGTIPTSACATCDISLQTENYVCLTNTEGDNNDGVTVEIPYTGSETSGGTLSTTSLGVISGDISVADGTITITGLSEGDAWDLIITGGDCDGTSVSGTIPASLCEPTLVLPFTEDFNYPDGSLVGNGQWESSGGTPGDLLISSGEALVQHGSPSEDVFLPFTPVTGNLYYGIDFTVNDPGGPIPGTDNEYFAHFKDSGFNYSARIDIVPPTGAGDFSVGIASDESTADAVWATDLSYGTTYRAIVRYDQDNNIAELWIDATAETDTSILGEDRTDPGDAVVSFALRQSDSNLNEGILVDNLKVSQTFNDATLGVNRLEFGDFNLYPNPTNTGYVNITSTNNGVINAKVFDILGKKVIDASIENNRLDVNQLKTGIYIIKMTQGTTSITKKLVIE